MTCRSALRLGLLLLAVPALVLCLPGVALAHVTVEPTTASPGGEVVLTFRVPDEAQHASTTRLVFAMPSSPPIPAVSIQPVPGWSAQLVTRKLTEPARTEDGPVTEAVSRIVWSADDKASAIAPGQFQQFTIQAGPLPGTGPLVFRVLQYYSDGTVVRWIDPPVKGQELTHPAPVVSIDPSPPSPAASAADGASPTVSGDGWIAVAAFVAGLLGLAAGTSALVHARGSRKAGPEPADPE